jgi:hypothetical protein
VLRAARSAEARAGARSAFASARSAFASGMASEMGAPDANGAHAAEGLRMPHLDRGNGAARGATMQGMLGSRRAGQLRDRQWRREQLRSRAPDRRDLGQVRVARRAHSLRRWRPLRARPRWCVGPETTARCPAARCP